MERKERARQEEIIHRMQIKSAQRGKNEHQKEKEEERYRRKVRNPTSQGPGLQFLRHLQRNVESGNEVLVIPLQFPALRGLPLFRGR